MTPGQCMAYQTQWSQPASLECYPEMLFRSSECTAFPKMAQNHLSLIMFCRLLVPFLGDGHLGHKQSPYLYFDRIRN
jgi:hypothetical protein